MLSDPDAIEISNEQDSPIQPTTIEEEVVSMPVGSSSIPKRKRQDQKPSSTPPQKRHTRTSTRVQGEGTAQTRPSSLGAVDSMKPRGISIHDILGYVTPTHPRAKPRKPTKNQKYPLKLPPLPEGMIFSVDIIPALIKLKFEDHDFLLLKDV